MTSPRRGARRRADISPRVLKQLNRGELEAATLVEVLAIDFAELLAAVAPTLARASVAAMRDAAESGVTHRMALAGQHLHDHFGLVAYLRFARHRSDTVRGWAAFLLAVTPHLTLGERLRLIRPLANDANSGVREWAWLALRALIAADLAHAIDLLEPWTISSSPFLRRFASEATRPRGVWCAHIEPLKREPALGMPVIEPLRADPHRYVQDSVSNWLNDAAKSQPAWVRETCIRWLAESPSPATERICRRAQRSIGNS
ncbi:MAG TPA: DNA alkylation repair protein [Chthoniobacteraceae bacterium]|nr:DNA alkylation repair protein [Chthoniobacteraceae bacterium]